MFLLQPDQSDFDSEDGILPLQLDSWEDDGNSNMDELTKNKPTPSIRTNAINHGDLSALRGFSGDNASEVSDDNSSIVDPAIPDDNLDLVVPAIPDAAVLDPLEASVNNDDVPDNALLDDSSQTNTDQVNKDSASGHSGSPPSQNVSKYGRKRRTRRDDIMSTIFTSDRAYIGIRLINCFLIFCSLTLTH